MSRHRRNMSCEEFSACMAELIAAGEDIFAHPHLRQCKLHRDLLIDLETIASAAKQMFPDLDPPDTVWDRIEARIAEGSPDPLLSSPSLGFRVAFSMKVIEHGSPPPFDPSPSVEEPAGRWQIFGFPRSLPRKERRR